MSAYDIVDLSNKLQDYTLPLFCCGVLFILLAAVNPIGYRGFEIPKLSSGLQYLLIAVGIGLLLVVIVRPKTHVSFIEGQVGVFVGAGANPKKDSYVELKINVSQPVLATLERNVPDGSRVSRILLDPSYDEDGGRMYFSEFVVDQKLTRQGKISIRLTPITEFNTKLRFVVVIEQSTPSASTAKSP